VITSNSLFFCRREHGAFDATQLKALKDCLPTNEEQQGLQRYMEMAKDDEAKKAAFSDLSECEKYMYTMIDVPNAQKKFDCMLFCEQFHSRFNELVTSIRTLEMACDEVKGSKSLREILGIILIVVNRINTGGMGNEAAGFSLDALLKLNEVGHTHALEFWKYSSLTYGYIICVPLIPHSHRRKLLIKRQVFFTTW
jgi:Formin Homology 2 Domain